jgi:hypothetical protein
LNEITDCANAQTRNTEHIGKNVSEMTEQIASVRKANVEHAQGLAAMTSTLQATTGTRLAAP